MTDVNLARREAEAWFARLGDIEASEADWLAFIDWIEGDPARRSAYDALERAWVELDAAAPGPAHAPPRPTPGLTLRAVNDDAPRGRPSRRWLLPALGAVAAVAAAVGVWPQLAAPPVQVYASDDRPRTVALADGSTVWLNRHTRLEARMDARRRMIVMGQGEAAFDVRRDGERPFVVRAGERQVRVLGTAFNVMSHADAFAVGVERGAVAVSPAGGGRDVRLVAGRRLRQSGRGPLVVAEIDPRAVSAWRDGLLVYRAAPLPEIAEDLSRYLGKSIMVAGPARTLRFTGVLKVDDEAALLDQLQAFAPVRVERSATGIRVTTREGA